MCVKAIVRISPIRAASRADTNAENAEHTPIQNSSAPAAPTDRSNRRNSHSASERLHDEAAAERIEAEHRGEAVDDAARRPERRRRLRAPAGSIAGDRRPVDHAARCDAGDGVRDEHAAQRCSSPSRRRASAIHSGTPAASEPIAPQIAPTNAYTGEQRRASRIRRRSSGSSDCSIGRNTLTSPLVGFIVPMHADDEQHGEGGRATCRRAPVAIIVDRAGDAAASAARSGARAARRAA